MEPEKNDHEDCVLCNGSGTLRDGDTLEIKPCLNVIKDPQPEEGRCGACKGTGKVENHISSCERDGCDGGCEKDCPTCANAGGDFQEKYHDWKSLIPNFVKQFRSPENGNSNDTWLASRLENFTRQSVAAALAKRDWEHGAKVTGQTSDGYHTFDELYEHRHRLYVTLCRQMQVMTKSSGGPSDPVEWKVWRSKLHSDGSSYDGWFVLGMNREAGKQITYHLPLSWWDETGFAQTYETAPCKFDGHTSDDVLKRLANQ